MAFCVGFTLSWFACCAIHGNKALVQFATADGLLQLTVYSKLANENVSIEDKQKMLESCVRSGLTCIEVTKDLLPYSIFRSQRIYTEVGIIKTNFYAIKARNQ